MADPEIIAYIKDQKKQGFADVQLRVALSQAGWSEAEIEEAFTQVTFGESEDLTTESYDQQPLEQDQPAESDSEQASEDPSAEPVQDDQSSLNVNDTVVQGFDASLQVESVGETEEDLHSEMEAVVTQKPKKGKGGIKITLAVILILFLMSLTAVGGYFAWSGLGNRSSVDTILAAFTNLTEASSFSYRASSSMVVEGDQNSLSGSAVLFGRVQTADSIADVKSDFNLSLQFDGLPDVGPISLDIDFVNIGQRFFFKFSDLPAPVKDLMTDMMFPDLASLIDQWLYFDIDEDVFIQIDDISDPLQEIREAYFMEVMALVFKHELIVLEKLPNTRVNGEKLINFSFRLNVSESNVRSLADDIRRVAYDLMRDVDDPEIIEFLSEIDREFDDGQEALDKFLSSDEFLLFLDLQDYLNDITTANLSISTGQKPYVRAFDFEISGNLSDLEEMVDRLEGGVVHPTASAVGGSLKASVAGALAQSMGGFGSLTSEDQAFLDDLKLEMESLEIQPLTDEERAFLRALEAEMDGFEPLTIEEVETRNHLMETGPSIDSEIDFYNEDFDFLFDQGDIYFEPYSGWDNDIFGLGDNISFSFSLNLEWSDFNEPVNISAPEGASSFLGLLEEMGISNPTGYDRATDAHIRANLSKLRLEVILDDSSSICRSSTFAEVQQLASTTGCHWVDPSNWSAWAELRDGDIYCVDGSSQAETSDPTLFQERSDSTLCL